MNANERRLSRAKRIARFAVEFESRMWSSLFRWIRRAPVAEPGATPFAYSRRLMPILGVFIAVSAIEIPIIDLILPWTTVRIVVASLGVYGLIWMIGLVAMIRINPHVVGESGLRIRGGSNGLDVTIPWDYIASIHAFTRGLKAGDLQVDHVGDEVILSLGVLKETNVDIRFRHPTILEIHKGDTEPLREVRIAADEPDALVTLARQYQAAARSAAQAAAQAATQAAVQAAALAEATAHASAESSTEASTEPTAQQEPVAAQS